MSTRRWLVTGGSSGMGRAIVEHALEKGEQVVVAVRRPESVADLVTEHGPRVEVERLDVSDVAAVGEVVGRVVARGPLDVVVNNAGFSVIGAAEELATDEVDQQLDTMLRGPIAVTRAALPALRANGGHVVQISSIGGQVAFPGSSIYHAAKWGLEGFTESLAQEVAEFGVRVTIVEPGAIRTGFASALRFVEPLPAYGDGAVDAFRRFMETAGPELFTGDPAKVATVVYEISCQENPPLRLPLGADAFDGVTAALRERLTALEPLAEVARSIALDPLAEQR